MWHTVCKTISKYQSRYLFQISLLIMLLPIQILKVGSCHFTIIERNIKAVFREYFSSLRFDSCKIFKITIFNRGPKTTFCSNLSSQSIEKEKILASKLLPLYWRQGRHRCCCSRSLSYLTNECSEDGFPLLRSFCVPTYNRGMPINGVL